MKISFSGFVHEFRSSLLRRSLTPSEKEAFSQCSLQVNIFISLTMVRRKFEPALKKNGIGRIRFHDLRHTFASILIDLGENPKYIQNQMGHSSIKITFDTYGHLMNTVNKEGANRLGNAVFGGDGSKMVAINEKGVSHIG